MLSIKDFNYQKLLDNINFKTLCEKCPHGRYDKFHNEYECEMELYPSEKDCPCNDIYEVAADKAAELGGVLFYISLGRDILRPHDDPLIKLRKSLKLPQKDSAA